MERMLDQIMNHQICDSFQGNTNTMLMAIHQRVGDAAGDVQFSANIPGGVVYTGMEIRTSGNTAGLTLDLGWRGNGESRSVTPEPTVFGAALAVAASGRDQLLDVSYPMTQPFDRQIDHQLTAVLGGTITPDETVEILVSFIYTGVV